MSVIYKPLYWATIRHGIVEYHSHRTGYEYKILPDHGGFTVESVGANLTVWTAKREDAIRLIEMTDLASLANDGSGECIQLTG
jgi:hypothetical protein